MRKQSRSSNILTSLSRTINSIVKQASKLESFYIFIFLLIIYHFIFKDFFPTPDGMVGHDFSIALPSFYAGYLWFINNGIFNPPWFTPAFCGGIPFFADPQSGFYSLPQFIGFILSPLQSAYLTVLISASLGYWGFYRLLKTSFNTSDTAAILAGALFMFNSFLSHRALVGEYGFHGIMLVPFIASLLIGPSRKQFSQSNLQSTIAASLVAALLIAYWLQSGLTTLIIPATLSVVGIACLTFILKYTDWRLFLIRSTIASISALTISASKLVASWSFFRNFPRTQYLMPGIDGIGNTIWLIIQALFFSSEGTTRQSIPLIRNAQWAILPHEWAYSLSIIPLIILLSGLGWFLIRIHRRNTTHNIKKKDTITPKYSSTSSIFFSMVLVIILAIPILLLVYYPTWSVVLKSIPIINATAWPFRWIIIYISIILTITAIVFNWIPLTNRYSRITLYTFLSIMLLQTLFEPRDYYLNQSDNTLSYDPSKIERAFNQVKITSTILPIEKIMLMEDIDGNTVTPISRNDAIIFGASQLECYNPIFGYRLEKFPLKSLHPGFALEQQDGVLNIKNPACYVFPKENNCQPGDHFSINDYKKAKAFLEYHTWHFNKSASQATADDITIISLISILTILFFILTQKIISWIKLIIGYKKPA